MIPRPPTVTSTRPPFPYTTLFRSTPKRLDGRIRDWNDRRRSAHRSRGTPPSGVRAANDIFSLRHRHQALRQRLLLGRIAPLHDIIVLHAVDARPVPPVCGGKLEIGRAHV